jgi:hypothetical protein
MSDGARGDGEQFKVWATTIAKGEEIMNRCSVFVVYKQSRGANGLQRPQIYWAMWFLRLLPFCPERSRNIHVIIRDGDPY